MSSTIAIYRLPTPRAAPIGRVRVVQDRNRQIYIAGSRVATTTPSGEFLIVTLENEQIYYVKATDYDGIMQPQGGAPAQPSSRSSRRAAGSGRRRKR